MEMPQQKFRRLQRGVGMLEVLIALVVLVFGALGFAGLQLTALRNTSHANYRAHATLIAQDAVERVIANYDQIAAYRNAASWASVTPGGAPPDWKKCMDAECSGSEMAAWDIANLSWIAANAMPNGRVVLRSCEFNGNLDCVVVSWADQDPADCTSVEGIETRNDSACLVLEVAR